MVSGHNFTIRLLWFRNQKTVYINGGYHVIRFLFWIAMMFAVARMKTGVMGYCLGSVSYKYLVPGTE